MLDSKQQKAFDNAMNNPISIISGFSGSGKSFTAKKISKALVAKGWNVSRVAPTGKASLLIHGQTIHSFLQPDCEEDKYGNPKIVGYLRETFDHNMALIVDECSMIDNELWNKIMEIWNNTIHENKKIIFVGDSAQLEPVGDGTPYIDAINKGEWPITFLETIHRNKQGNDISEFANGVRTNQHVSKSFKNVHIGNIAQAINATLDNLYTNQIICPMKNGDNGVNRINKLVQEQRNLQKKAFNIIEWNNEQRRWLEGDREIFVGDKVVITRNNFLFDLTNGTIGILLGFASKRVFNTYFGIYENIDGIKIKRDYDNKILFVPLSFAQKNIDLAYALTVHKYQGSECENVYCIFTQDQKYMLRDKKLIYTAITRAKENLYIIT